MMQKVITLFLATLALSHSYNFLVLYPYASKSHTILGNALVGALLDRGHQVTYGNPFPTLKPRKGLTVLDFRFLAKEWEELVKDIMPQLQEQKEADVSVIKEIASNVTYLCMKHKSLQTILMDKNQHFDAVISDWFLTDILAALPAAIGSPTIMMAAFGMFTNNEYVVDEVASPGVQPLVFMDFNFPMSFFERVQNTFFAFSMIASIRFIDHPAEALAYKDLLAPVAAARDIQLPDYTTAVHNVSLVLANSHHSMFPAAKLPPNVVEIGGFHVDPKPDPLAPELQKIMDNAKDGVIFFSLGSNLKSRDLALTIRNQLIDLFRGLKQTVIWKFEEDLPNLPANVHIVKWAPQQSILAHPKTKIFMTHGGLLSSTEAIHHGVPLIGIPFYGDQHLNVARAVKKGYALQVMFTDPNFTKLLSRHINDILQDPKYALKAKELSALYHDRPTPPKELAVYWIEYVVRTGGATHLRSAAMQVSWYQRYLLDTLALLLGTLLLVKWIVAWGFNKLARKKRKVD